MMQKILISGSTGLVGEALVAALRARGENVVRLARREGKHDEPQIQWSPMEPVADAARFAGFDAVVHLAGEPIAAGRWNSERKRLIRESRTVPTHNLSKALAAPANRPRVFICASAVGFYGERGDEILTEKSAAGSGYLADVCQEWEAACEPLRRAGTRVVNLRISAVLSPKGGALAKMLPAFKLGAAGRLGSGKQWMSWIALDDMVGAVLHCLDNESIVGPVNCCAPEAATNVEFTRTLAGVLHRPAILPAPAWALRLALGEMADALLLSSIRMKPESLEKSGFRFRHPGLEEALRAMIGKNEIEEA